MVLIVVDIQSTFHAQVGMNYGLNSQTSLLKFSNNCERASLFDENDDKEGEEEEEGENGQVNSMAAKRRSGRKRASAGRRKGPKVAKGVKFSNGRIALKLAGFGLQKLGAVELVRYIPLSKLKAAARKVLRAKGAGVIKKKRRKGSRRRKTT